MFTGKPSIRPWKTILGRVILDIAIGITIGASLWTLGYSLHGKLVEAIKGNIEDAISTLQGLMILGAVVGGIVGIAHGLAIVGQGKKQNQDDQR